MGIAGTWYNELGSQMDVVLSGSTITGTYWTAVGNASGQYDLIGLIDPTLPSPGGQATGWTVVWKNGAGNSNSVTTWSGQLQLSPSGSEEIVTFWLLTSEQLTPNDWGATKIGKNVFTRTRPTPEKVEEARRQGGLPFPK